MKVLKILSTKFKVAGIGAALCGSLFCVSPITAFAGGLECTCETKCTEEHVNPDCPICREDYKYIEAISMKNVIKILLLLGLVAYLGFAIVTVIFIA